MMNVDLLLNQEIKYIIPIYEKRQNNFKEAACFIPYPTPSPFPYYIMMELWK